MKRVVLILIIVGIVGAVAGGAWLYFWATSPMKQLARADLALLAGNFDRALELADGFIAEHPDDWRGHYSRGRALTHLGKYEEAREALARAVEAKPGQVLIHLAVARTHSTPAREGLAAAVSDRDADAILEAVAQLDRAGAVLKACETGDPKAALDVRENLGLYQFEAARAHYTRHALLQFQADRAGMDGRDADAERLRTEADQAKEQGDQAVAEAAATLAEVVKSDPARQGALRAFVAACATRDDRKSVADVLAALEPLETQPPMTVAVLLRNDLALAGSPDREKLQEVAGTLDALVAAQEEAAFKPAQVRFGDTASAVPGTLTADEALEKLGALLEREPAFAEVLLLRARVASELATRVAPADRGRAAAVAGTYARAVSKLEGASPDTRARAEYVIGQTLLDRGEWRQAEEILRGPTSRHPQWSRGLGISQTIWLRAHLAYARAAEMSGQRERARRSLQAVLEANRSNPTANQHLAQGLLADAAAETVEAARDGLYREAFDRARAAYEALPDDPDVLRLYVQAAVRSDRPATAREVVENADKPEEDRPQMMLALADCYAALAAQGVGDAEKDRDRALALARQAADATPAKDDLEARLAKAAALGRLGRASQAELLLTQVVDEAPDSAAARFRLGALYEATNRVAQAVEQYEKAVELAPAEIGYRLALARAQLGSDLLEDCLDTCRWVLQRSPENRQAEQMLSAVRLRRGEIKLEETPAYDELEARGGLQLALQHLRQGEPQKCIDICRDELRDDPEDLNARRLLARAYLAQGEDAKAVEELEGVIRRAPQRLASYVELASVLARSRSPQEVERALAAVDGAKRDRIDLTMGILLERSGRPGPAAEAYARAAENTIADLDVRALGRVGRARTLAQAGHLDRAIVEMDRLAAEPAYRTPARLAKAGLLVRLQRLDEAGKVLQELRTTPDASLDLLRRLAGLYLRAGDTEAAVDVCREAVRRFPADALSHAAAADAYRVAGRTAEAVEEVRRAITLQPGNYALRTTLARILASQQQPAEALAVLQDLKALGEVAEIEGLFAEADLLARRGLHAQAVERLEEAARTGQADRSRVRLALGRAFAGLGKLDQAREELEKVPEFAAEYLEARQLLVALAESDEKRMAILDALQTKYPRSDRVVLQRMAILREADRPADAVKAFEAFLQGAGAPATALPPLAEAALQAMLEAGDLTAAADLAVRMTHLTRHPQWRGRAVLLQIETRPEEARGLLPEPPQGSVATAALGLCLALRQGTDPAPWADRIEQIQQDLADASAGMEVSRSLRLLAALAVGRTEQAEGALKALEEAGPVEYAAAREMVASASGPSKEAAALMEPMVAFGVGLSRVARPRAVDVLKLRPTCQWAAVLAARAGVEGPLLEDVVRTLKPDDCLVARALRAGLLIWKKQYREAAALYAEAARDAGGSPELRFQQAAALEVAGDLQTALPLYAQVWQETQDPTAANNAAYLTSQLHRDDPAKLEEALGWVAAAVEAQPDQPAYLDTKAWLQHLLGRDADALPALRRAVTAYPNSAQVHYHLGVVEASAGSRRLARWHLQAAVDFGGKARDEGRRVDPAETEAAELARETLARLDGSAS